MRSAAPASMIWPRYMTTISSEMKRTTARSWLMKSSVVSYRFCTSFSRLMTAACTDTSRAETGSSAITVEGLPTKERATAMRCFWPPDSWRGLRVAKAVGRRTMSSISPTRSRTLAESFSRPNLRTTRPMQWPTEWLGFKVPSGFWNTICRARMSLVSRFSTGMGAMLRPSKTISPSVAVSRPVSTLAKVDLPQPDSPTMATVRPRRARKFSPSLAFTQCRPPPWSRALSDMSETS